jgi:HSP20 family protein
MRRFRSVFDNMFDTLFDFGPRQVWNPAMNVYREGGDLTVELALPGVDKKDIEVRLEGENLTISGQTKREEEVRQQDMYRREIFSGSFSRSIRLPAGVQAEQIKAECKDGVLKVRVPVSQPAEASTKIEVE